MFLAREAANSQYVAPANSSWSLITLYACCLVPFSINGLGVNYLFVLIPLTALMSGKNTTLPKNNILLYLFWLLFVFVIASIYQLEWIEYYDRRVISFVLFLTMFSMCFVRLSDKHVNSFKAATLIAATYFSLESLALFVYLGPASLGFEAKDLVGGQRYGFVYILAFWMLWYDSKLIGLWIAKYVLLTVLIVGMFLTFSRASVVAFGFSCLVSVLHALSTKRISPIKALKLIASGALFVVVCLFALNELSPIILEFFSVRLVEYVVTGSATEAVINSETSDGTRLFIWENIVEFVIFNPITGAGFLGPWVLKLFENDGGSAHSQYFDILFRVGPLLFLGYLAFLFQMLRYFIKNEIDIFVALVGILVYGMFHETFKESHGTFIFAMLIAMWSQRKNLQKSSRLT